MRTLDGIEVIKLQQLKLNLVIYGQGFSAEKSLA